MANPIEAEGLVQRFGDIVAVDHVDLTVAEGEIFGFLGQYSGGMRRRLDLALSLVHEPQSQRAAPLMQIGIFVSIFLATAQVPLAAMTGWLHAVARVNPMTNVLRLARVGFLGPVIWEDCWGGLLALAIGTVLAALFAARQFRNLVP